MTHTPGEWHIIPDFIPARQSAEYKQTIPLDIYQTGKTNRVTQKYFQTVIQKILDLNPEYNYHFYDDQRCREFLAQEYGTHYRDVFDNIRPGAFKADFWRYALLAKKGGVYIDLDFVLVAPLQKFIAASNLVTIKDMMDHHRRPCIFQAFIAAIPQHPFNVLATAECYYNFATQRSTTDKFGLSGPSFYARIIMECENIDPCSHFTFREGDFLSRTGCGPFRILHFGYQITWAGRVIGQHKSDLYQPSSDYSFLFEWGFMYHSDTIWSKIRQHFRTFFFIALALYLFYFTCRSNMAIRT
jgi:hypothetical protein